VLSALRTKEEGDGSGPAGSPLEREGSVWCPSQSAKLGREWCGQEGPGLGASVEKKKKSALLLWQEGKARASVFVEYRRGEAAATDKGGRRARPFRLLFLVQKGGDLR